MKELGVKVIYAHSPQAKGRVERAFATLQDRLVKELRLNNIHTIEDANLVLLAYIEKYNEQFSQPPANPLNAHRPLNHTQNLHHIFSIKEGLLFLGVLSIFKTEVDRSLSEELKGNNDRRF